MAIPNLAQFGEWVEDYLNWLKPRLNLEQWNKLLSRLQQRRTTPDWFFDPVVPTWLNEFIGSFPNGLGNAQNAKQPGWLLDLWISEGYLTEVDPGWIAEIQRKFKAGVAHQFILHFNVNDYVFDVRSRGYTPLSPYLWGVFRRSDHVLFYNRSQGITGADVRYDGRDTATSRVLSGFRDLVGLPADAIGVGGRFLHSPHEALLWLEALMRKSKPESTSFLHSVVIFDYAEKVVSSRGIEQQDQHDLLQVETLQRWALDEEIERNKNLILLLAQNLAEISGSLRQSNSRVEAIEIPMPNLRERLKFISFLYWQFQRENNPFRFDPTDFKASEKSSDPLEVQQLRAFASLTSGLNRLAIRDIVLRSVEEEVLISLDLIRERKTAVIRTESMNLLEVMEPRHSLSALGGLEEVKQFLRDTPAAMKDESRHATVPAGLLFLGPPGTGKTLAAEAMAFESGVNCVKLGNVREMWVGQSERNLSRALSIIKSMAPVIVFIDELDQSEGSRGESGDSGVGKRIFAQLLQFMSDSSNRGNVLWIAASNRPDLVDDAMRRSGRFDEKIAFLVPNEQDRVRIFEALLTHKHKIPPAELALISPHLPAIADRCEGYTGAEIEVIVNKALRAVKPHHKLSANDLDEAQRDFLPGRNNLKYTYMTLLALREVDSRRFIPDRYAHYFKDDAGRKQLEDEISALETVLNRRG